MRNKKTEVCELIVVSLLTPNKTKYRTNGGKRPQSFDVKFLCSVLIKLGFWKCCLAETKGIYNGFLSYCYDSVLDGLLITDWFGSH